MGNSLKVYALIGSTILIAGIFGCENRDKFTVSPYPEWSYDKPFYYKPVDGVPALDTFSGKAPDIYTDKMLLEIPRPKAGDSKKAPRIAIWMTEDSGIHWKRIGFFGLQQPYFPYRVEKDGKYGIRFIGPGIPPAKCKPPKPHMNFYVDTVAPEVTVFVSPDEDTYTAGEMITLEWVATDLNLKENSVQISVCMNSDSAKLKWDALGGKHPCIDQAKLLIPDEAIDKTITIRVTAEDKAGNLGHGYSCPINIVYEPPSTQPATKPAKASGKVITTPDGPQILTTMPADFPKLNEK